jgi:hypothetical protein
MSFNELNAVEHLIMQKHNGVKLNAANLHLGRKNEKSEKNIEI